MLLTHPPSTTTLALQAGDVTNNALLQLAKILQRVQPLPKLLPSTTTTTPIENQTQLPPVPIKNHEELPRVPDCVP